MSQLNYINNKPILILEQGQVGHGILIENDGYTISSPNNIPLIESKEDPNISAIYVDCVLQKGDTLNKNKRIYPLPILKYQVEQYQELIKENSATGEADHPDSSIISLHNFAHRVVKVWWEGPILYGTLEILTSTNYMRTGQIGMVGDKIAEYLHRKIRLGISSRGIGSVKEIKGNHVVQDDFELIGWDLVHSPSTPGAYLYNLRSNNKISKGIFNNESTNIITTGTTLIKENIELENFLNKFLG